MKAAWRGFSLLEGRDKFKYFLAILAKLALVGLDLVGLLFIGVAANLLLQANFSPTYLSSVTDISHALGISNIYAFVAAMAAGFFIAKAVFSLILNYLTAKFLSRVESELSSRLFKGFLRMGLGSQAKWSQNQIIQGVQDGAYNAFSASLITTSIIVGEVSLIISVSILLFSTNAVLFMVTAVYLGSVAWLVSYFINKRTRKSAKQLREISFSTWGLLGDLQESYRQVYLSPLIESYAAKFRKARRQHSFQQAKISILQFIPRYVLEAALMIGIGLVLVQRSFDGGTTFPLEQIAIFFAGVFRIIGAILPLQGSVATIRQIEVESEIAFELVEAVKQVESDLPPVNKKLASKFKISFESVSYSYANAKKAVFKDLTIEINEGEFVAIQGKSGAGKSTLADLVMGLREATGGKLRIAGESPRIYLAKNPGSIAYIPQKTHLIKGTFLQNITMNFDDSSTRTEKIHDLLSKLGLEELVESLPNGFETSMGSGLVQLSGGQLQRVGIARALYSEPKILILDEITSALDPETEVLVDKTIAKLKGKVTVLSIAHRKSKFIKFDKIISL